MNDIIKKVFTEIVRVIAAAILASIGVEASGCIACGDGASASCVSVIPTK